MQTKNLNANSKTGTCPPEHMLNDYVAGVLDETKHQEVERHVADCTFCIFKISEAYAVLNESKIKPVKEFVMKIAGKINLWLVGSIIMFVLSFFVRRFFVQFLVGAAILGMKWIVDSKTTKMLVMIYEAWKHGGRKEAEQVIKTLDSRMNR